MIIVACTLLALLVIVAGMKLLAQTSKDNLGNLYKYVSWFVIVMGFLCLLCTGMHCAMKCCHRGHERMEERCMMMHGGCDEMRGGCNDMMYHHGGMGGCMMHHECCNEMMSNGCSENMGGSCKEGSECHEGMGSDCKMGDGGSCPMMKGGGHCEEKDSVVVKKEIKK